MQNEDDGSLVEGSEGRFGQRTQCRLSSWTQRSEKVDAGEEVENMGEHLPRTRHQRPTLYAGLLERYSPIFSTSSPAYLFGPLSP